MCVTLKYWMWKYSIVLTLITANNNITMDVSDGEILVQCGFADLCFTFEGN